MLELAEENSEQPKVRVVVPALNEEINLKAIIKNIAEQNYPCEIVIADNGSTDKSVEVVEACQQEFVDIYPHISIKLTKVPQRGVANARNAGARLSGEKEIDYLIFLDADTRIDPDFIRRNLAEMERNKIDVGACTLRTSSDKMIDRVLVSTYNKIMKVMEKINPSCVGAGLVVKPNVFEQIDGFDPKLEVYEDADFIKKASKVSNFGVLHDAPIDFSMRRLEKEGRFKTVVKYFFGGIYYYLTGKKLPGMKYEFGNYKKKS